MNNDIRFITITNSGYLKFTKNCYASLKANKIAPILTSVTLDKDAYNSLTELGYPCELFDNAEIEDSHKLIRYRETNWKKMMYLKMRIIYDNLDKYDYVCVTDGDIVFENKNFMDYTLKYLKKNKVDIIYQNNGLSNKCNLMCAGFVLIKSSVLTKTLYDASLDDKFVTEQEYLRSRINKLGINYKLLPLHLFPNGNYYYKHHNAIKPFLIHFNWISCQKKVRKMKQFDKWYLDIPKENKIDVLEKTKMVIQNGKLTIEKNKYNSHFGDFAFKKKKIFYVKLGENQHFFKEDESCNLSVANSEDLKEAYYIQS